MSPQKRHSKVVPIVSFSDVRGMKSCLYLPPYQLALRINSAQTQMALISKQKVIPVIGCPVYVLDTTVNGVT
ncbi:hypothetical protein TNCV_3528191 [Trichonephila clavipes]|nr:hypothetical protein TNCV_3528191 [Trichonephila clavipes]